MAKLPIEELSRQPLVRGTSCFTDPDGNVGYKTEDVQVSALVRIAAALEQQTKILAEPNLLTLAEYSEVYTLLRDCREDYTKLYYNYDAVVAGKVFRLCELVEKLLSGVEKGAQNNG